MISRWQESRCGVRGKVGRRPALTTSVGAGDDCWGRAAVHVRAGTCGVQLRGVGTHAPNTMWHSAIALVAGTVDFAALFAAAHREGVRGRDAQRSGSSLGRPAG